MSSSLPSVKATVQLPVGNLIYQFHRLLWTEADQIAPMREQFHLKNDLEAILVMALDSVSGKKLTKLEATQVIQAFPPRFQEKLYQLYKGSLDLHRMFSAPPLYVAPDTQSYTKLLVQEEEETDEQADQIERQLVQHYGPQAANEEIELNRQIQAASLAGAQPVQEGPRE